MTAKERKRFRVHLGQTLRKQRGLVHMNMRAVAKASGVSLGAICKIEKGQVDAGVITIFEICRAIGLTPKNISTIIYLSYLEAIA